MNTNGNNQNSKNLISNDIIMPTSKRLPTFIGISNNNTISKASQRKIRKTFDISFVGKSKKQQKKILRDYGKKRKNGKRFRSVKDAYYYLSNTYNDKVEIQREKIREKRRVNKNKQRRAVRQLTKLERQLIRFDTTGMKTFEVKFKDMNMEQVLKQVVKTLNGKNVVLKLSYDNKNPFFYTLNSTNIARLLEIINNSTIDGDYVMNAAGSDAEFFADFSHITKFEVQKVQELDFLKTGKAKENSTGGFFKYVNKTHFDLSRYGIYKIVNPKNYKDNCLIKALRAGGLDDDRLNELKSFVVNRYVPQSKLRQIAESLDIKIIVKKEDSSKKNSVYGNNDDEIFKIGVLDKHYFLIEDIQLTRYSIQHYKELQEVFPANDFNNVFKKQGKYYKRSNDRFTNSYKVIKDLLEFKDTLLEPICFTQEILQTQFYDEAFDLDNLNYSSKCAVENGVRYNKDGSVMSQEQLDFIEELKFKNAESYTNVFFDFETYCEEINGNKVHIPYLVCWGFADGDVNTAVGKNCGKKMLEWCSKNCPVIPVDLFDDKGKVIKKYQNDKVRIKLIAHNAGYDYRFINKFLFQLDQKTKGSGLMNARGLFMNKNKKIMEVEVKDSYKIITMPLSGFGKCFNLPVSKEVMPYNLYNINTITKGWIPIHTAKPHLKSNEEYETLRKNCKKWDILKVIDGVELFNIITYSIEYCKLDIIVLRMGYNKFREWIKQECNIDINGVWTIASLADKYLHQQGVYKGVYKLSGLPRIFIQKCVVGGRTMCRDNIKYWKGKGNKKCKIADFDACSLYPASMVRLGDEYGGTLKGKPKIIQEHTKKFLDSVDGYFVKVKITKVKIHRHFSLISQINDKGVRVFHNEMVGEYFYMDKTALDDAIKFMGIEFEVIKGYYYDEGRNPRIKKVLQYLYDTRLKKKAEKNPIQVVYKLIMNSSYGKSILKPINTEEKIIDGEENALKYIQKNYNKVVEYNKLWNCNKYRIKVHKAINEHYNNAAVGVEILSMSKRIMNEVICLAEDENLKIYYQDTDSIHIGYDDVAILKKSFTKMYGRELDGKLLGQFHIDFDLKVGDDKATAESIISEEFIALGKKCYIDSLVGKTKEGKVIRNYHIRMKGVPNTTIHYTAKVAGISVLQLYRNMFRGKAYEFDLLEGGARCNFKFGKDGSITSMNNFKRTLSF